MNEVYKPPGCETLDKLPPSQIRVGIQGEPFNGKTTAALTFPNPIILSFDKKVAAHSNRSDVIEIPFWNPDFVNAIVPKAGIRAPVNRKEALLVWFKTEGVKLTPYQTMIVDGLTKIEEAYHIWYNFNEADLATTRSGDIDSFVEWNLKKAYFEEFWVDISALKCNVLIICHEVADRDKKGELNGKIRPLMTGQSGDKIGGNVTDMFAAIAIAKPSTPEQIKKTKEWGKIDDETLKEWIASTPTTHQTIYLWQTQADEIRSCGTTSLSNCPKYVLADYKSFAKYGKNKSTEITQ